MDSFFKLRIPFRPISKISGMDATITIDARPFRAELSESHPYFVLTVDGFKTANQAQEYFPTAWAAIMWASISACVGFQTETTIDKPKYFEDPVQAGNNIAKSFGLEGGEPIHGIISGNFPVIYSSSEKIKILTMGDASAYAITPIQNMVPFLEKALGCVKSRSLYTTDRLRLALELWSNHHREQSTTSKFITLVMLLEVLTEPKPKLPVAQELLDQFAVMIDEKISLFKSDSVEFHSLNSLKREIIFRREQLSASTQSRPVSSTAK